MERLRQPHKMRRLMEMMSSLAAVQGEIAIPEEF